MLGISRQNNGKIKEAITNYEQAAQIADETHCNDIKAKAYQHLDDVFCENFEYTKAIEYYKKAHEISQPSFGSDNFEKKTDQNAHNNDHINSEHTYQNVLNKESTSLEQLFMVARSCQNNGNIEKAIKNYEKTAQEACRRLRDTVDHVERVDNTDDYANAFAKGISEEQSPILEQSEKAHQIFPNTGKDYLEKEAHQQLGETVSNFELVNNQHQHEKIFDNERINSAEQLLILGHSCQGNVNHVEREDNEDNYANSFGEGISEEQSLILECSQTAHEIFPNIEKGDLEEDQQLGETVSNVELVNNEHKYENIFDQKTISAEQLLILGRSSKDSGNHVERVDNADDHANAFGERISEEQSRNLERSQMAHEIFANIEKEDLEEEAHQQLGETVANVKLVNNEHKYENIFDEKRISAEQLLILGRSCQKNGRIQEAIKNYEQAVQIAGETHRNDIKAKAYRHLENIFCEIFDYKKAIEYYEKASEISLDIESNDLKLEAGQTAHNSQRVDIGHKYENTSSKERITAEQLLISGRSCYNSGKVEEAIENYQKAIQVAIKTHRNDIKKKAYQHLENAFCSTFEYDKAVECYRRARQYSVSFVVDDVEVEAVDNVKRVVDIANQKPDNLPDETRTSAEQLLNLENSCQNDDKIEEAVKHCEQAVQVADKTHRNDIGAKAYQHLGNICTGTCECEKATKYYKKAHELFPNLETDNMEYYNFGEERISEGLLLTLKRSCQNNSQIIEIIKTYEQAVQISDEADCNGIKARTCQDIGNVFTRASEYEKAIEYYQKAREISSDFKGNELEVVAYEWLGYNYLQTARYQKSIKYYAMVVKLASNIGDEQRKINAYFGLGSAYSYTNDFQSSRLYFLKALTVAEKIDKKVLQTVAYTNLGDVYYKSCMFEEATKSYLQVLKNFHNLNDRREEANTCLKVGKAFQKLKQYEKAIQFYKKALNICNHLEDEEMRTEVIGQLGTVYFILASGFRKDRNYKMAIKWFKEALNIFRQLNDEFRQRKAIQSIGEIQKLVEIETEKENPESWKWEKSSIVHREKFIKLLEYGKDHPEDIKEVNGVRVCCSEEFLIGMGSDGTRVYIGLGKDGYERAVKRLPRDACTSLAEQEKKVLYKLHTTKSNYVVNYWFLDEQSDKHYLFLILDLCEETLENFVARSILDDLLANAPVIIQQILKGLVDLHCEPLPILHRDLKPSNILRNIHDKWLLADFGISRILPGCASTHPSKQRGTEDWRAVESSCPSNSTTDGGKVSYKKESDVQVAGIVAFYIVTKGEHPFGEKPDRLRHLLDGKPIGLDTLKDPILKDLLSWMLSHNCKDRPSAKEALKHPYLQPAKAKFEMLCKMGNQHEVKTQDIKSDVVRKLNSNPKDWRTLLAPDVLQYLSTDCCKGKIFCYKSSWTDCLRLIRNVKEHWNDRPRPRPAAFYSVGDPQKYFLDHFPNLPVEVHRIVRSCDWKKRPELKEYFM